MLDSSHVSIDAVYQCRTSVTESIIAVMHQMKGTGMHDALVCYCFYQAATSLESFCFIFGLSGCGCFFVVIFYCSAGLKLLCRNFVVRFYTLTYYKSPYIFAYKSPR